MPRRVNRTFPVTDFGAVADGVTDDTAAIQAANDAANKFRGLAAVSYPSNATLLTSGGIVVYADQVGNGATLKLADTADNWIFNVNEDDVWISNLNFDGNKANQPAPGYNANYDGLSRNSLIQAYALFYSLVVEECSFKDTQYGAMAFIDQTPGAFYTPRYIHPDFPTECKTISSLTIRDNKFRDLNTMIAHILNPYEKVQVRNDKLYLNGRATISGNNGARIGTVLGAPLHGTTNHGNAFICSGFHDVEIFYNRIDVVARECFKHGANNNLTIGPNNVVTDAHWAFCKAQTFYISPDAQELPGRVIIRDNQFATQYIPGHFAMLGGSTNPNPGHCIMPYVDISDNKVSHEGPVDGQLDAIQINGLGKYRQVNIRSNAFSGLGRAALNFVLTDIDGFRMEAINVTGNMYRDGAPHWPCGLVHVQGTGLRAREMNIEDNTTVKAVTPVNAQRIPADRICIKDNRFLGSKGTWNLYSEEQDLDYLFLIGNQFDQLVHEFKATKLVVEDNRVANVPAWPYTGGLE